MDKPNFKVAKNIIEEDERMVGSLPAPPPGRRPDPRRYLKAAKKRVDAHFIDPENRAKALLAGGWVREWRSSGPKATINAVLVMRAEIFIPSEVPRDESGRKLWDRYLISRRGNYVWFTVVPHAEEMSDEQALAWNQQTKLRGKVGARGERRKSDDGYLDF